MTPGSEKGVKLGSRTRVAKIRISNGDTSLLPVTSRLLKDYVVDFRFPVLTGVILLLFLEGSFVGPKFITHRLVGDITLLRDGREFCPVSVFIDDIHP